MKASENLGAAMVVQTVHERLESYAVQSGTSRGNVS